MKSFEQKAFDFSHDVKWEGHKTNQTLVSNKTKIQDIQAVVSIHFEIIEVHHWTLNNQKLWSRHDQQLG